MPPQLLVSQKKEGIFWYHPGFVLSVQDIASRPRFLSPFGFSPSLTYHPREFAPVGEIDDFPFPFSDAQITDDFSSLSSLVFSRASVLCRAVEEEIRYQHPQATHYVFSTFLFSFHFFDGIDTPALEIESFIDLYRFIPLRQRAFPFAAHPPQQLDLFYDCGLSRYLSFGS